MKKLLWITALFALCAAGFVAAQEGAGASAGTMDISKCRNVGLLSAETYSQLFVTNGTTTKYTRAAKQSDMNEAARIAGLNGNPTSWDTAEEIALLSATAGVINIRPVEAADMLPAGDPALVDLQLGAMLYMKKAAVSFLGGGDPAKYAAEIKFITDRGRVTEADIISFMVQGISAEVDNQFKNTLLPPGEIKAIKDILAIFFLRPNTDTFNAVRDVSFIYTAISIALSGEKKRAYEDVTEAYDNTLRSLNPSLVGSVTMDIYSDGGFRYKSGADNVVTLANMIRQYITQQR
jgi:hypothetical protein